MNQFDRTFIRTEHLSPDFHNRLTTPSSFNHVQEVKLKWVNVGYKIKTKLWLCLTITVNSSDT